jgi:predicted DNA-binding protein
VSFVAFGLSSTKQKVKISYIINTEYCHIEKMEDLELNENTHTEIQK